MIFLIIPIMVLIPLTAFLMACNQWEYRTYVKPKFAPRPTKFYLISEEHFLEWAEWRLGPKCDDPQWWDQRDELIRELEI